MKLYRYLTGPDDATFCHRVSQALSEGWELHGSPTLAFNAKSQSMICGQAIIKQAEGDYRPDMDLAKQG